jgi:tryptophan synthase alpha subunit
LCDGAIVGSAVVRAITQAGDGPPEAVAAKVGEYCHGLLARVR